MSKPTTVIPPRMLLSGHQSPHISAKMGLWCVALLSRAAYAPASRQPTPDGNPEEHRKFYERYIKGAKEREEARFAVKKFLYSSGIGFAILTLRANLMTLNTIMSIVSVIP